MYCTGQREVTGHSETGQGISAWTNEYGHFGGDPFKWAHRAQRACAPFHCRLVISHPYLECYRCQDLIEKIIALLGDISRIIFCQ